MEPLGSDYLDRPRRSIDDAIIDRVLGQRHPHSGVLSAFLRGLAIPMIIVRFGETLEDQQIVYINEAVSRVFGYRLRDVIYRPPSAFCADTADTEQQRIAICRRFGAELGRTGLAGGRFHIRRHDGQPVEVEVIAGVIRLDATKERFYAAFGRVTEAGVEDTLPLDEDTLPPAGA